MEAVDEHEGCWSRRNVIGYFGCVGGLFMHLVLGSIYQWGIINIYVASYFKLKDPAVTLQSNAVAFPIIMFCTGITVTPGLYLAEKSHPLLISGIVVILQAGCVLASSFTQQMWPFMVCYGILFGFISGFNFMIPVVECNKYFPGRKMYINGFILVGTGVGPLIFGMFSYSFLNPAKIPHNKGYYYGTPELEEIAARVPKCLRWLSLFYLVIGVLGFVFLIGICRENRRVERGVVQGESVEVTREALAEAVDPIAVEESFNQSKMNSQNKINQAPQPEPKPQAIEPQSLRIAVCSKVFWIKTAIMFLGTCGPLLLNVNYKTYVKLVISDDQFLTIIGIVSSIGNGFSRFFWNIAFNHTGYRSVMLFNLVLQILVFASIRFTVFTPALYLIQIFVSSVCFGGFTVLTPTFSHVVFGPIMGSKIYGIYALVLAVANAVQFAYVIGLTPLITFDGVIYLCLGKAFIAALLVIFSDFQGPWNNNIEQLGYCRKAKDNQ